VVRVVADGVERWRWHCDWKRRSETCRGRRCALHDESESESESESGAERAPGEGRRVLDYVDGDAADGDVYDDGVVGG